MSDKLFNVMLVLMAVLTIGAFLFGHALAAEGYKRQAIQHGAAYYNPTNANFEWKNLADANKTNK